MSDLDPHHIVEASQVVDDVFLNSPQFADPDLSERFGRTVVVKLETCNPLRSFKGRGADYLMHRRDIAAPVFCVTAGNFGQALAWAARSRGVPATVFVPRGADPVKRSRMRGFGAEVVEIDGDLGTVTTAAQAFAQDNPEQLWIQDGFEPAVAEGAGTIGRELMRLSGIDTIVVPVGDAALINGIGCWVKHEAPSVRIVGVGASGAPAMAQSWRGRVRVPTETVNTVAAGLAIREPIAESLKRMSEYVDDFVLVDDDDLRHAVDLAACTLGVLLEPSGAAAIAALARHDLPGDTVATILTGAEPRELKLGRADRASRSVLG